MAVAETPLVKKNHLHLIHLHPLSSIHIIVTHKSLQIEQHTLNQLNHLNLLNPLNPLNPLNLLNLLLHKLAILKKVIEIHYQWSQMRVNQD